MRDPARIDRMLEKLRALWHANPDLRLGQLVENLAAKHQHIGCCVFHVEDDATEQRLDEVLAEGWS